MLPTPPKTSLRLLNALGFIGTLAVNALANALPINGKTTGEISDQYPNLFTPAGLTFSVWGLIYLLLTAFCVYQAKDRLGAKKEVLPFVSSIGYFFLVSCGANAAWILAWHYEQVALSLVLMLVLFTSLLGIYLRLDVGRRAVSWPEKFFVHVPFSVYLAWITVATIANATAWLVDRGWRGGASEAVWAMGMVGVAALITLFLLFQRRDVFYGLVVLWALAGILTKRLDASGQMVTNLVAVTGACFLLVGIATVLTAFRRVEKVRTVA
ncbi:MAG: tryptophan-rich sensory protein [Ferruginibacter sp.]|nr:tryptophan-rich sensory protein [Cytophagales bacterium]